MLADLALAGALPELREREKKLRALAAAEGITYEVADFGGLRTLPDTNRILEYRKNDYAVYVSKQKAAGKPVVSMEEFRPIAPFGSSFHNYGAAFDVRITGAPKGMTFDQALTRLGALGAKAGLIWGGLWARPKNDRPHFQLSTGLTQAKEMWEQFTSGKTPTKPAATGMASILAASLPGVQVIASRPPTPTPTVAEVVQRHPLATTAVSTGALVAAALLTWVVVRRFTED